MRGRGIDENPVDRGRAGDCGGHQTGVRGSALHGRCGRRLRGRDKIDKGKTLRIADLEIDTALQRVTRAGKEIPLTQREYLLAEALATREGQVLTRDMIQQRVWWDDDSYSNTVDVYISSLRK